jgi:dipeptidyl aminopeptidase/acylaminoacyl peptidase
VLQKMICYRWLFVFGIFIGSSLGLRAADSSEPLPIEDVVGLKLLRDSPRISPDGKYLAYTVKMRPQVLPEDNDEFLRSGHFSFVIGADVLLQNARSREIKNLSAGKGNNWGPVWSPDGNYLAFASDRDGGGQAKAWVWDMRKNELRKVSDVPVRLWGVQEMVWSRDSQSLFLPTLPAGMSVAEYVAKVSQGGSVKPSAGDAGSRLTVTLYESGSASSESKMANGRSLGIDETLRDVLSVNIETGQQTAIVANQRVSLFRLTKDNAHLVYSTPLGLEADGSQQILYNLVVSELPSGKSRVIASRVPLDFFGRFSMSPDSTQVAYRATSPSDILADIFVAAIAGGGPRNLTRFGDSMPGRSEAKGGSNFAVTPIWDARSSSVFFVAGHKLWQSSLQSEGARAVGEIPGRAIRQVVSSQDNVLWTADGGSSAFLLAHDSVGKRDGLFKIDLGSGVVTTIFERNECYVCEPALDARYIAVDEGGGNFAYVAETAQSPADIWRGDRESGKSEQMTHLNPEIERFTLGVPRVIDWLDDDGRRLEGGLLLPAGYVPGKRYPLLVVVYGGVNASNAVNTFGGFYRGLPFFHPQLFATRGYAVFSPDAPQQMGTPMLDLAKTVLPGVNKVIEMGVADPERLGLMGHSYGGYSTMSLLVETKRFSAAVETDGMADLIGLYGEMEKDGSAFGTSAETSQELVGGSPWQFRERYIENSPIFYLDRMETPLLIIHGDRDVTFAPFLGDEIFVGLRRLGKTVNYAKYQGEPHVASSRDNLIDMASRILDWFERYVKGGGQRDASHPLTN